MLVFRVVVVFPTLAAFALPAGWDLRLNFGPRKGVIERSLERVRALRRAAGRKVSLVGWSLGGVYARELAKMAPDDVRCVVTLGSPFTGHPKANNAWRLYQLASGHALRDDEFERVRAAPPVPTTSIFSRSDGIVAWRCCLQRKSRRAESIEVPSSHFGIGLNPAAWYALADRLAQPEGRWRAFHRDGWRKWLYQDPYRAHGPG